LAITRLLTLPVPPLVPPPEGGEPPLLAQPAAASAMTAIPALSIRGLLARNMSHLIPVSSIVDKVPQL
jgi:hypothetical protein